MAIATTSQTLHDGPRRFSIQVTGVSDGTGNESLVKKVDVSSLTPAATRVSVEKITGNVRAGRVELYWDALTPVKFADLSGDIRFDYTKFTGLENTKPGGWTGDILLSTADFEMDSSYTLHIEMIKKF